MIARAKSLRIPSRCAAALLGCLLAGYACAGPPLLPPLNDPPTTEWFPGKFVWIDLVTPDPAAARRFYGGLFGWAFADLGDYALAYDAGDAVAGIARRPPPPKNEERQSRWIAYMSVPDVAASAKLVESKGGRILIGPRNLPDRGEMAVLADPDDAAFGVIRSTSGDPGDFLAPPGDFAWAVYQSPASDRAAAFYQDLGNYEVVADDRIPNAPDFLLVADGFARASIVEIPTARSGLRPDWLYFVRVNDINASVARAKELGARVLAEPRADLLEGRLAVIIDPVGAPLGLLQLRDAGTEEGQ